MVISPQHDAGFHSWRYANIAKNNSAYVLSEWPDILLLTQFVILVTHDFKVHKMYTGVSDSQLKCILDKNSKSTASSQDCAL